MAKITEINKKYVLIENDGKTVQVLIDDLDCTIKLNQEVDVFYNGEIYIVKDKYNDYVDDTQKEEEMYDQQQSNQFNSNGFYYNFIFNQRRVRMKKYLYVFLCLFGFTGIQRILTKRYISGLICFIFIFTGFLTPIPMFFFITDLIGALLKPVDNKGYVYI